MPSSHQNLAETSLLEEALQLTSLRCDARLSAAEDCRLKELEAKFPVEIAAFRQQCLQLHGTLQALPIQPVGRLLVSATRLGNSEQLPDQRAAQSRQFSRRTCVSTSIGAVILTSCLMFGVMRISNDASRSAGNSIGIVSAPHSAPEQAVSVSDVRPNAGESGDTAREDSEAATNRMAAVRPLLQNEHWNIVVLKVSSKDHATAIGQIQTFLRNNGLSVQGLNRESSVDKSAWLGVVLTSAPDSSKKFIDDAIQQGVAESADWDAREIAEATQEELINAIRRSMDFPTQSELYHGEIYVEISRIPPSLDVPPAVAATAVGGTVAEAENNESSGVKESASLPAGPAAVTVAGSGADESKSVLSKSASAVTLVVFQFQPSATPEGNIGSDGRI